MTDQQAESPAVQVPRQTERRIFTPMDHVSAGEVLLPH